MNSWFHRQRGHHHDSSFDGGATSASRLLLVGTELQTRIIGTGHISTTFYANKHDPNPAGTDQSEVEAQGAGSASVSASVLVIIGRGSKGATDAEVAGDAGTFISSTNFWITGFGSLAGGVSSMDFSLNKRFY